MNTKRLSLTNPFFSMLFVCLFLSGCGGAKINCNRLGAYEDDLMIIGYELNRMSRSIAANRNCMQFYLRTPQENNGDCWNQLATTSGTQSVSGVYVEAFSTIEATFVSRLRTSATSYNDVLSEVETCYSSLRIKNNFKHFENADPDRVKGLISRLDSVEQEIADLQKSLRRMTGVAPEGEWGYCNGSNTARAEIYVGKNTRHVDYIWEPLRGE